MSNKKSLHRTSLLLSGTELMNGDTIDTNSAMLATVLSSIGIEIAEKATVPDLPDELAAQIRRLCANSDLLIINGGLGPTSDDLTAEALSKVAGEPLAISRDAEKHILEWCRKRSIKPNQANLKQALLPCTATIFPNCPGSAPAFFLRIGDCVVIATPGVPCELEVIARDHLVKFIAAEFSVEAKTAWKKYSLIGIGESRLQQEITEKLPSTASLLEIGYRVHFPLLEFKYRPLDGVSWQDKKIDSWESSLNAILHGYKTCSGDGDFAQELVRQLRTAEKTFCCAESCTGGLVASMITRIPGASAVFSGGVVSYSNPAKEKLLMVPEQTLAQHGAVSRETASAMLQGVLQQMGSDYGVAITGIAGPDGGTAEKPVGTVWLAWGETNHFQTLCLRIPLERIQFQKLVGAIALDLCTRWVIGEKEPPRYLSRWKL